MYWLPIPVFAVAIVVLSAVGVERLYYSSVLFRVLNLLFLTVILLVVSFLAGRAFITRRSVGVLLMGMGALSLALGSALAALEAGGPEPNQAISIYNTSALLAGLCHVLGTTSNLSAWRASRRAARPILVLGILAITLIIFALLLLIRGQLWPTQLVQGTGQTTFGFAILVTAIGFFAVSAVSLGISYRRTGSRFTYWYGLGLGLVVVGLVAVSLQNSVGDPLNWVGRSAQYMGAIYLLVAVTPSIRGSSAHALMLEGALRESQERYRGLVNLSPEAILVDTEGLVSYVNPAAVQLLGAHSPDELLGKAVADLIQQTDRDLMARHTAEAGSESSAPIQEITMLRLDGGSLRVEAASARTSFDGASSLQIIVRDITERRRVERSLRESEERFRSLVANIPSVLMRYDREFRVQYLSPQAEAATGIPAHHFIGRTNREMGMPEQLCDLWETAIQRVFDTGEVEDLEFELSGPDGSLRAYLLRLAPETFAGPGEIDYVLGISTDITNRKRAEEERRHLVEELRSKTERLSTLLEESEREERLGAALADLANAAVTGLDEEVLEGFLTEVMEVLSADSAHCVFVASDGAEQSYRVGARREDGAPRLEPLVRTLAEDGREGNDPILLDGNDIPWLGCGVLMLVPLLVHKRVTGWAGFAYPEPRRPSEDHMRLARRLSSLMSISIENAWMYDRQRYIAQTLQESLLDLPLADTGVRLGHLYRSATEQALVGGDFYDVFAGADDRVVIVVGDVCGHGVEAARTATLVKDVVHAYARQDSEPGSILHRLNRLLLDRNTPGFVTVFVGVLDPASGSLAYSSAGHPQALIGSQDGEVRSLQAGSPPVGVFPHCSWADGRAQMNSSDTLLVYTDGVTEARRDGLFFGEEGLMKAFRSLSDLPPEQLPQALLDKVLLFSEGRLRDDVAIVALTLSPDHDAEESGQPTLVVAVP